MKVCAITATCGRHTCVERCLSFFLNQDYVDRHLLIYQNSEVHQTLDKKIDKSVVTLVNQHIDSITGKRYETLGAIYNDALKYVPEDTDVIIFMDDDDIFLPNHISNGVEGLKRAMLRSDRPYKAYKPSKAYFRHSAGITEVEGNTMEPSIFVLASHIREYGFSLKTTEQHLQWVHPLVGDGTIFVDPEATSTLIYNWGDNSIPTFKTSGDFHNPHNFENYRNFSQDHGDLILSPQDVSYYYTLV